MRDQKFSYWLDRLLLTTDTGKRELDLQVKEYVWGQAPEDCGLQPPYDLILGADCIYDIAQVKPFLQSLRYEIPPSKFTLRSIANAVFR